MIASIIPYTVVIVLIVFRKRLGVLNAASFLVIWGSLILLMEHPQFSLAYTARVIYPEGKRLFLFPHARIHFFMAGIYSILGLIVFGVLARTLLKEGRRTGWYTLLFVLVIGGGIDLMMGGLWYQHGSPIYFMKYPVGFGWQFFYVYLTSWIAALVISYEPIFKNT